MCTWIDAEWEGDVRRYPWYVARRGPHVYAQRQRKQGRSRTIIALARVIAGLQDMDSGER
jgi:alpha-beta hydrolase superfamily lysophospholipase